ncbi:isopenicillin N synthase family oxygenase [Lujinxingia vulgaris]|uniref:Isopenicillin N synthase family oxygenase n=1 Tax=Lujinxingia vulgaris TaxID=2600176 RepID=A0A5C6WYS7_9DELT|nr:2-oxoglutarate and iron-dependent oxygenase domain-containing protein [Lujinxingia vulgaris]TXD32233.1 isopenicillin N synthase family oxygenase [Lujinxingia vulgaris]
MAKEQTIPVVDLRDYTHGDEATRQAFVKKIGDALKELGFVAVEGHGVDTDLLYENYDLFEAFFALDDDTKRRYESPETGRQRGYTSFGVEHAKNNEKADLKEFWHLGRDLPADHPMAERIQKNVWPEEVPKLREKAQELYQAMENSAETMLKAISLYLGQEESFLPNMIKDGNSIIRVIHYPVCDGFDEPGTMRAAEHEDINLITLLPEATQSGLELLERDGTWRPIHAIKGQMIVDSGDMLARITNNKLPSTTHRVVNPEGDATSRYSMPFFVHPHPDYVLKVLDTCLDEGEEPASEPITAEEFLFERLREIGLK